MAEGLFRHAVRNRKDVHVASAGVATSHGQRPSENGVEALRQWNIDIRSIRSQPLSDDLVTWATHIYAMTRSHLDARALGPLRFRLLVARARMPVIALGGMTGQTARRLAWPRWAAIDGLS